MSGAAWRSAAAVRLQTLAGEASHPGDGAVLRVSVEVEVEGRSELVVLGLDAEGELRAIASDGQSEGPHVRAALAWLADASPETGALVPRRVSMPPPAAAGGRLELADALDELLTTAVRLGALRAPDAVGLSEASERLLAAAPSPTPWRLARALGRLRSAAVREDLGAWARVLEGLGRLATQLRDGGPTWVTATSTETLTDRQLLELGREHVAGLSRGSLERRYLVCVRSGEVFEEHLSPGPAHGLRLLQYTVRAEVPPTVHARLAEHAAPRAAPLLEMARAAWRDAPARAEPFAILAVEGVRRPTTRAPRGLLLAADGALPIAGRDGVDGRLAELEGVRWVAGRLVSRDGELAMRPLMAGLDNEGRRALARLR
ncbi:MAG: hypothetical protein AAGH15_15655, partial [Myxococcota bacterium]